MLDLSGVSFMDCAGLRAIIELTGAREALAMERRTTDRSVQFF